MESGVCVPSPPSEPASGLQGGVAGQGVRVLGQEPGQFQTGLHATRSLPQLRGNGRGEGVGGE